MYDKYLVNLIGEDGTETRREFMDKAAFTAWWDLNDEAKAFEDYEVW